MGRKHLDQTTRSRRQPDLRINLALQGGGAHGAFTWGVLERLAEYDGLHIHNISATSAGAVNAVAFLAGLAKSGPAGAKANLEAVWDAVYKSRISDFVRFNPLFYGLQQMGERIAGPMLAAPQLLSPYQFNPFRYDPLRKLLEDNIDFDAVRASQIKLHIAATDISTGRAQIFTNADITVDTVLASACLPTLHHAVEIEGRHYWDGGFSANPDLLVLARQSATKDTLLVLVNPLRSDTIPTSAPDIAGRINRITFNQPLLRDIAQILEARRHRRWLKRCLAFRDSRADQRLASHRFHLIAAGPHTSGLSAETKVRPERTVLEQLHRAGRMEADIWLHTKRKFVGRRDSAGFDKFFASAQ